MKENGVDVELGYYGVLDKGLCVESYAAINRALWAYLKVGR